MSDDLLLTFNAGSSSLKLGIFKLEKGSASPLGRGKIDFEQSPASLRYTIGTRRYEKTLRGIDGPDFNATLGETLGHVLGHLNGDLRTVAHRVVHGGLEFLGPAILDDKSTGRVEALTPLAPLHQPKALRVIHALRKLRPHLEQTASFDTAFHASQDDLVRRLAIPHAMHEDGVRRYGFHGLSYKFIAQKLSGDRPEVGHGRVVIAHLGSGASLCALTEGISRDTSMGFSALDGVPMATRPGALDAGAILYLMRKGMASAEKLENFLYQECGLLGVSGISGDTRVLLKDPSPEAAQAIDLFCLRIAGEIARMCATIGGLDTVVFTGGVGENQPEIRKRVVARLGWLGAEIDDGANGTNAAVISSNSSAITMFVIPTDEEQVIADEAISLIT